MKRIVRLTESDLTRIVRRVIMEQPEGSALGEEEWLRIPFGGVGTSVEVYGTVGNLKKYYNAMWSAKATKETKPNDRGVSTPTGNVTISFRLKIGDKIKPNNRTDVTIACSTKKIISSRNILINDAELAGFTYTVKQNDQAVNGLRDMDVAKFKRMMQALPALTYTGAVKEMADAACAG